MITKDIYCVLSVEDISRLFRVAQRSQKKSGASTTHCVVLEGLEVSTQSNGEMQLRSSSVNAATRALEDALV